MRLKEWLKTKGCDFCDSDLRFLVKNALGEDLSLLLDDRAYLDKPTLARMNKVHQYHKKGIPLAYLLGKEEFFGLEFEVDSSCLIPRKETELLVEKAIEFIKKYRLRDILDLCCGCANIAITIKKELKSNVCVWASDISLRALRVAKKNASFHGVSVNFIHSDLFGGFKERQFDIIVSNPPYVENGCIRGSLRHEPRMALSGGRDGLDFIRRIFAEAGRCLRSNGYIIMEMGSGHRREVENLLDRIGGYEIEEWIKDYSGHYRAIALKKSREDG
jgi:release factor glutamine methyltransferase